MGFLEKLLKGVQKTALDKSNGLITTGRNKNSGGHDHRTNKGDDRTPAQKKGDKSKKVD